MSQQAFGDGRQSNILSRNFMKSILAAVIAILLLQWLPAAQAAHKKTDRSKQKVAAEAKRAEAKRAEVKKKLTVLKREISKTETAEGNAAETLAASEAAISAANRSLHELAGRQQQTEGRLKHLSGEQVRLSATVAQQQQRLAKLLRHQYVTGNENRMKLLLSGDNPNRINRELQYMGYASQAQARLIAELRASIKAVEENKSATQTAKKELDEIVQGKQTQKTVLETEKQRRAALLAQLSSKLTTQRQEADRLQRDQQRLTGLVDRLSRMIAEQKKAAAKRRPPPRPAPSRTVKGGRPQPAPSRPEPAYDPGVPEGVFAGMRGRLKLPVQGTIAARFGSKREAGPSMKGMFISTPEGAQVRAVAPGKVVFAGSLRGFGNLIIIDHGSQYMTIYGNNQSLLKRVGETVKGGDVIASTGNSGGNEQSGLYFEMRHRGRAFDPMGWM